MIKVDNLTIAFGSKRVLDRVSFHMNEGDKLAIIGPSGEGKSVLLQCILGLLKPDSGSVEVDGVDIINASEDELDVLRKKMGILFQGSALFDFMNVYENVSFPLVSHSDFNESEIKTKVEKTLNLVGLKGASNKMPDELSGGMQKRVALARAIVRNPKFMFYDEPTSGLDPVRSKAINQLIGKLNNDFNLTSVTVTHDMLSLDKVANKVLFLLKSKIAFYGKVSDIRNNKMLSSFINGDADID